MELARDLFSWNIRNWKRVQWSDETRFLLRSADGRVLVSRHGNNAFRWRERDGYNSVRF
jgi:hypothetical protein